MDAPVPVENTTHDPVAWLVLNNKIKLPFNWPYTFHVFWTRDFVLLCSHYSQPKSNSGLQRAWRTTTWRVDQADILGKWRHCDVHSVKLKKLSRDNREERRGDDTTR